ncbi:hypothetical protein N8D55_19050 [Xanthomonas hortorum pv. pelargonii]|nr:hypothetical protein N8D55_19050 [Xanthomonas hortorum pv. pelargonii]
MLTALKSGVKFLTKSEVKCVFHHASVCFYYFFDKSLENSDLDHVSQDISKLNTHVQSRQKARWRVASRLGCAKSDAKCVSGQTSAPHAGKPVPHRRGTGRFSAGLRQGNDGMPPVRPDASDH